MSGPEKKHKTEDLAIRVMYFFNTMDTYLIASVLFYLFVWYAIAARPESSLAALFPPFGGNPLIAGGVALVLYLLIRSADFHPLFALFSLVGFGALLLQPSAPSGADLWMNFRWIFLMTSVVQIVFMGVPMGLAARSPAVPLRIYLNSFVILAPTTISFPLTLYYQFFLVGSATTLSSRLDLFALGFLLYCGLAAFLAAKLRKKGFVPGTDHPSPPPALFRRAIILNVDGLSRQALDRGDAPFLKSLEQSFAFAEGGARTVYRALTNPAFASILAGVEPARHGVTNNNFNQAIRTEALPDILPTRLYGNMHVRHFSRPGWKVAVVSLVEVGYRKVDEILLQRLRADLLKHRDDVKLWVTDLSEVDYCGHAWGSYSRRHGRAVARTDCLIKDFLKWLEESGLFEDTLVIVSSDHGLYIGEHSFILHPREERVPLIFVGKGIKPGRISGEVSIIDIAANISYALGAPYCQGSRGRVFREIFSTAEEE